MAAFLRQVFVIQCRSTGEFLSEDLGFVRSLKFAGRAPDFEHALETAHDNLDDDFEIHEFFERHAISVS